jgi:hypothetical protein
MIGRAHIEGSKKRRNLSRAGAGRRRVLIFSLEAYRKGGYEEDSSVELDEPEIDIKTLITALPRRAQLNSSKLSPPPNAIDICNF